LKCPTMFVMFLRHLPICGTLLACFTAKATTWQKHGSLVQDSLCIAATIEGALSVVNVIGMSAEDYAAYSSIADNVVLGGGADGVLIGCWTGGVGVGVA
jgi:hypothetical protein